MSKTGYEKPKRHFHLGNMNYQEKRSFWGLIFLIPWIIGILVFFLGPLVRTFYYSLFDMQLQTGGFSYTFKGIENFKYALTIDPDFNTSVLSALGDTLKNVPIQIFVSLFVAMLLNGDYKGKGFFRMIFFVPIILATGITEINISDISLTSETSKSFFKGADMVIEVLGTSGIPTTFLTYIINFVNDIFDVITTSGVQMLIFLAGLQGISPSLYEVAKIEGCSRFESFCKITLPMISPMILVCMIYSLADCFAKADISDSISTTTFSQGQYGLGAAMSVIYFIVSLAVVLLCSYIVSKVVFYYDK